VQVLRCSRVAGGAVVPTAHDAFESAGSLTPGQARVELLLRLMRAA
jgi:L-asparaginase